MITEVKSSTCFLTLAVISLSQELAKIGARDARKLERLRNSGLLNLLVPEAYGGYGETWFNAFKVVRKIAKADGYLGQLLGYHYVNSTIPKLFGMPEQNAYFSSQSVACQWLWGTSINDRTAALILTPDGENFRLDGVQCGTGIEDSDVMVVRVKHPELERVRFAVLSCDRQGIAIDGYSDLIARSNIVFDNVFVHREEVLENNNFSEPPAPFATLLPCLERLIITNLHLGIALGALATKRNPLIKSSKIIACYGDFWVNLSAAESQADRVASLFQAAWDKGKALSVAERHEVAIAIACAQVFSARVGLDVTSKLLGVIAEDADEVEYRCRMIRAHILHEPVSERVQEVGNWLLNKQVPFPTHHI